MKWTDLSGGLTNRAVLRRMASVRFFRNFFRSIATGSAGSLIVTQARSLRGKNVLGGELESCSLDPLTGYTRSGCCEAIGGDLGMHVVCARMTDEFLEFSRSAGNDLSTPVPEYGFPGLVAGDQWCLCALRWKEALEAGAAPQVVLEATHMSILEYVSLEELQEHAWKG